MRKTLLLLALFLPMPAFAHVGHLEAVEGHSHYLAAWALLGAIVGSCWLIWTEMRREKPPVAKRAEDDEAGA